MCGSCCRCWRLWSARPRLICAKKDQRYQEKISKSCKQRFGTDKPSTQLILASSFHSPLPPFPLNEESNEVRFIFRNLDQKILQQIRQSNLLILFLLARGDHVEMTGYSSALSRADWRCERQTILEVRIYEAIKSHQRDLSTTGTKKTCGFKRYHRKESRCRLRN